MSVLIALVVGALCGLAAHALAKPKGLVGWPLLVGTGVAVAAAVWVVLTWLGRGLSIEALQPNAAVLWVIFTIIVAGVVYATATALAVKRAADDKDLFDRLSHVGRVNIDPAAED